MTVQQQIIAGLPPVIAVGQAAYTTPGTYAWVCPPGVTSVSAVYIGGGGHGASYGAGGGALGYRNDIAVIPGNSYTVTVGAGGARGASGGQSLFIDSSNAAQGGNAGTGLAATFTGTGGGNGGIGNNTGSGLGGSSGGAGGYSGAGGAGGFPNGSSGLGGGGGGGGSGTSYWSSGGGGTGILGQGASGAGGSSGSLGGKGGSGGGDGTWSDGMFSNGTGGTFGGGTSYNSNNSGAGPGGAVRIIWPGNLRQFPSTRTANE